LKYSLQPKLLITLLSLTLVVDAVRLYSAINLWMDDINSGVESYSFAVIFPSILIFILASMKQSATKEGLLMRLGCMLQLLLIISIPPLSLYLALGFPVVFLMVELFETKLSSIISNPIKRVLIK
jgi:hypothetical protein